MKKVLTVKELHELTGYSKPYILKIRPYFKNAYQKAGAWFIPEKDALEYFEGKKEKAIKKYDKILTNIRNYTPEH